MLHHHRPHAVWYDRVCARVLFARNCFFCSAAATWHTSRIASHCKRSGCTFYGSTETPNGYVQFTSSVIYFICLLPLWSRRSWNLSELFWLNVLFLISFLWFPIFFFRSCYLYTNWMDMAKWQWMKNVRSFSMAMANICGNIWSLHRMSCLIIQALNVYIIRVYIILL